MFIKIEYKFTGQDNWQNKCNGVVLVKNEKAIDIVFGILCEHDEYWSEYKNLIKVAPKTINHLSELNNMCEYCGKTDIYDLEELQKKADFILYQAPLEIW